MLQRSLTYRLVTIAEDAIGQSSSIFKRRFGLDVHQIRVLRLIRDMPGITFTDLARLTKFERSATSRMLSGLIKAGYVTRTNSPDDARRFTLTISPKGAEICAAADPLSDELERLMLDPLDAEHRALFAAMLESVLAWVREGYAEKVMERFPEARPPSRAKR